MGRSILLGVVGDSAAGKTTLTRGLVRVLGDENVTHVCVDDYHRYDRRQRAERNITPLHPDCNHMDIMAQQMAHLRNGEPFLKPVYQHHDGTFGPLVRVDPKRFSVVEGLLGYYTEELREPLRRADLSRPARGSPPQVEGAARLLTPRLHDRPGAVAISTGASPTRRRSSAPSRRTPTSSSRSCRTHGRPGAPRRAARPPADAQAPRLPLGARRRGRRQRRDPDHRGRRRAAASTSRAGSSASAPRRSRR